MPIQKELFDLQKLSNEKKLERSGSFVDNMRMPVHRWFRFSAGFSGEWVNSIIKEKSLYAPNMRVLDPFAGSGTTLIGSDFAGVESLGVEAHPFIYKIAKAKLRFTADPKVFRDVSNEILNRAKGKTELSSEYPDLLNRVYEKDTLQKLDSLRRETLNLKSEESTFDLAWLALTSILRVSSSAGTAQWQYILPKKEKRDPIDPFLAYFKQCQKMLQDMEDTRAVGVKQSSKLYREDARDLSFIEENSIDLVLTSPPYANNYDYADSVRLEMSFWGEVNSWSDLHEAARKYLIVSSSQHASAEKLSLSNLLNTPYLLPILKEVSEVCSALEVEKEKHGGKKHYHTMIAAYFSDMSKVFHALSKVTKKNAQMCIVIGDSAPYGVYVPVEEWLAELAISHGFKSYRFEKIRDRNVKWDNRVHKVPLKEGNLWIAK